MKMKVVGFGFLAFFIAGSFFVGCQTDSSKVKDAREEVNEAKQELNEAQQDANAANQKAASIEEWKVFKEETNLQIKKNEVRISELKEKMKSSGKLMDSYYQKRIEKLEQDNQNMQTRLDAYEKEQSDWESFKREFNHDMDELGQSLKDFNIDNKK